MVNQFENKIPRKYVFHCLCLRYGEKMRFSNIVLVNTFILTLVYYQSSAESLVESVTLSQDEINAISRSINMSDANSVMNLLKKMKVNEKVAIQKTVFYHFSYAINTMKVDLECVYQQNGVCKMPLEKDFKIPLPNIAKKALDKFLANFNDDEFTNETNTKMKIYFEKWYHYTDLCSSAKVDLKDIIVQQQLTQILQTEVDNTISNRKKNTSYDEVRTNFAAFMAFGYILFCDSHHNLISRMLRINTNNPAISFRGVLFSQRPHWYLTPTIIKYFNFLRCLIVGEPPLDFILSLNKDKDVIAIPISDNCLIDRNDESEFEYKKSEHQYKSDESE